MTASPKIPYEDTFLTFYNYKEPLAEVKDGYGYYGVLLGTEDGEKIQCHICGKTFKDLSFHIFNSHDIRSREYKEKFGLAYQTALISENQRAMRKQSTLEWIKTLTEEDKAELRRKQLEGQRGKWNGGGHGLKNTLETKNKRGTCPDQLLAKIKDVADKMGRTPSQHEFVNECGTQRYKHLIYKTFGSWKAAVEMLGMQTRERCSGWANGRTRHRYSQEEVLEYLRIFAQENNRIPTATDSRRGLIPDSGVITRMFGSWENAREEAGVYDFVDRNKLGADGGQARGPRKFTLPSY